MSVAFLVRTEKWYKRKWQIAMKIVLISTYELGRQPFGLVSPAAWLRGRGHAVGCFDLTRQGWMRGRLGRLN